MCMLVLLFMFIFPQQDIFAKLNDNVRSHLQIQEMPMPMPSTSHHLDVPKEKPITPHQPYVPNDMPNTSHQPYVAKDKQKTAHKPNVPKDKSSQPCAESSEVSELRNQAMLSLFTYYVLNPMQQISPFGFPICLPSFHSTYINLYPQLTHLHSIGYWQLMIKASLGTLSLNDRSSLDKLTLDQRRSVLHTYRALTCLKQLGVDQTRFSTILSMLGLTDSYNSMMGLCRIHRAAQNGVIGGVATKVGELKGFKDSVSFSLHSENIFVVKVTDNCGVCHQPFSSGELKQILRELAIGIYLHDTYPFFSLHFNEDSCLYPVIHPAYQNTLVGEVIGFLDYFMKGFLNGGVYDKSFLQNWHKSCNMDKEFLKSHLIDLQRYFRDNLPNSEYISLREMMAREGLEGPEQDMSENPGSIFRTRFMTSFRIISQVREAREQDGVFFIDPDFDVEYTIDLMPDYKEYVDHFQRENGSFPASYATLQSVYESMKDRIKTWMPKVPIFEEYFQKLGVISFCVYYLNTMKMAGRIPRFREVTNVCSVVFPKVLPPFPVRYYIFHKLNLTLKAFIQECRVEEDKSTFQEVKLDQMLKEFTQQYIPEPCSAARNRVKNVVKSFIEKAVPLEVVSMGLDPDFLKKNTRTVTQHLMQFAMEYHRAFKTWAHELFAEMPMLGKADEFERKRNLQEQIDFLIFLIVQLEQTQSKKAEPALPKDILKQIDEEKKKKIDEFTKQIVKSIQDQAAVAKENLCRSEESLKGQAQECDQTISMMTQHLCKIHLSQQYHRLKTEIDRLCAIQQQIKDQLGELQQKRQEFPARIASSECEEVQKMKLDVDRQCNELKRKAFGKWVSASKQVINEYSSKRERLSDVLFNHPCSENNLVCSSYHQSTLTIADGGYYRAVGDNIRIVGGCSVRLPTLEVRPLQQSEQGLFAKACILAEKLETETFSSEILENGGNKYTVFKIQTTKMNTDMTSYIALILSLKPCKINKDMKLNILTKLLSRLGADKVQLEDEWCSAVGRTTLDHVFESCDTDTCNFILQHDPASVSIPTESGILPLHTAASSGNVQAVKALLSTMPEQVNFCTNSGETPLIAAASRGHNETVRLLLSLSANVNHRLPCGLTALWVALQNQHEETSVTLINHTESNLMFILDNGENVLHEAVKQSLFTAATLLINHGINLLQPRKSDGKTPWHLAAELGQVVVLQAMLQSGRMTDVNVTLEELYTTPQKSEALLKVGTSALHCAAVKGHGEVATLLIAAKASLNLKNRHGSIPLVMAMENGFEGIALMLAEQGGFGTTTDLICAAKLKMFKVCDLLVRNGVSILGYDDLGLDYAYYLLINGEYFRYYYLAEDKRIDCNKVYSGASSLAVAAEHGHTALANYLMEKGVRYKFPSDRDLVHWLVIADDVGYLRKWLLTHSLVHGNITKGLESGKTLLYLAAEHASIRCLLLLRKCVPSEMVANAWHGKHILDAVVLSGNVKVLEILLPLIRDLNQTINPAGYNSMTWAAEIGSIAFIKQITCWGGSILKEDSKGRTPMQVAIIHNDLKLLRAISEIVSPTLWPKDIWMTANIGGCKKKIISWLFDQLGGEQKTVDKEKCVGALHNAIHSGDGNCVEAILQLMKMNDILACVSNIAIDGRTALALATKNTQCKIIDTLLAYGTKADFPPSRECALFAACVSNDVELLRKFYVKKAYSVPIASKLMQELRTFAEYGYIKEALSGSFMRFDRDRGVVISAIEDEKLKDYRQMLLKGFPINCTYINVNGKELFLPFALCLIPSLKAFLELSTDKLRIDALDKNGKSLAYYLMILPDDQSKYILSYLQTHFKKQFTSMLKLKDNFHIPAITNKNVKRLLNLLESIESPLEISVGPDGLTPLHLAVCSKNVADVSHFLDTFETFPVDKPDKNGVTALMMAAATGNESIIRELMAKGADPNVTDRKGRNAFHHALQAKEMKVSILLMSKMRDLSAKDRNGKTLLMYAVLGHMNPVIRQLIASGVDVHAVDDKKGFSALHYAAVVGNAETISILVNNPNGVNSTKPENINSISNVTPLHLASRQGHVSACNELLIAGAYPAAKYADGITPASLCFSPKRPELIQLFLHTTALHAPAQDLQMIKACCMTDNADNLRFLISLNVNVNAVDQHGMNALHFAAMHGASLCAYILLAANCSPNVSDSTTLSTPLHMAATHGCVVIIQELLSYGAYPHVLDKKGNTPLLNAITEGHSGAVFELLRHNVDCTQSSRGGLRPSVACFMQPNEIITQAVTIMSKELPSRSDVEQLPKYILIKIQLKMHLLECLRGHWIHSVELGDTFLHLAVRMAAVEVVHLLLLSEPKLIGIRNKHGETAFSVAQSIADTTPEVLAALRRHKLPSRVPDGDFDVTNWLVIDHQLHIAEICSNRPLPVWLEHADIGGNNPVAFSPPNIDELKSIALSNTDQWFTSEQQTEAKYYLDLLSPRAVQNWLSGLSAISRKEHSTYFSSWLYWCREHLCDSSCCKRLAELFLDHYPWYLLHEVTEWRKTATIIKNLSEGTTLLLWALEYFKPSIVVEMEVLKWKTCCQNWIDFYDLTRHDAALLCTPPLSESISCTLNSDYLIRCVKCLKSIPSSQPEQRRIQLFLLNDLPPYKVIEHILRKGYIGPIAKRLLTRESICQPKAVPNIKKTGDLECFAAQTLLFSMYHCPCAFQYLCNFFKKLDHEHSLNEEEKKIVSSVISNGLQAVSESWNTLSSWLVLSRRLRDEYGIELLQKLIHCDTVKVKQPVEMFAKTAQLMLELLPHFNNNVLEGKKRKTQKADDAVALLAQCLSLDVLVACLQDLLKQDYEQRFPEKPIQEVSKQFLTASHFVRVTLPEAEMAGFVKDYESIVRISQIYFGKSLDWLGKEARQLGSQLPLNRENQLHLFAIIRQSIRLQFGILPNNTQIIAAFGILSVHDGLKGRIAQVRTGEGKSTIITIIATFLACQGRNVDIITANHYLAIRDQNKYYSYYQYFGISCSHICQRPYKPEHFDAQVLFGTNTDFEFSIMFDAIQDTRLHFISKNGSRQSRTCDAVIVDEVDNLLIDTALNSARIANPSSKDVSWVYEPLWCALQDNPFLFLISIQYLRMALKNYQNGRFSSQVDSFSDDVLVTWRNSALGASRKRLDHDYVLCPSKEDDEKLQVVIVDPDNTGRLMMGSRWSNGVHEFVEVKNHLQPQMQSDTAAAMSHPAFFNLYKNIYGLTGTMGEDIERKEVADIYKVTSFDVPPHRPCNRKEESSQLVSCRTEHTKALVDKIKEKQAARRPVLVLFPTIRESEHFSKSLKEINIAHFVLNEKQKEDEEFIIAKAGEAGQLTIATNLAGRGTDIILSTESLDAGGLHIVFTFFPVNLRVEEQGYGRAGRQGLPGTCSMILSLEDPLICSLIAEQKEKEQLLKNPNFLQYLREKRSAGVRKESEKRKWASQRESIVFNYVLKDFFDALCKVRTTMENMDCSMMKNAIEAKSVKSRKWLNDPSNPKLAYISSEIARVRNRLKGSTHYSELKGLQNRYIELLVEEWSMFFTELERYRSNIDNSSSLASYKEKVIKLFNEFWTNNLSQTITDPVADFCDWLSTLSSATLT